jgi:hypothetical protein
MGVGMGRVVSCPHAVNWWPGAPRSFNDVAMAGLPTGPVGNPASCPKASTVRGVLRRHPAQGLGWQPDLGGCASAVDPDVGVADVLAAGEIGPGLPPSTSSRRIRSLDLAPLTGCTNPRGLKDSFAIAYRRAVK